MKTVTYTHRFTVRVQHKLTQEPYPEIHHGHACDVEITLNRPFSREDVSLIWDKVIRPLDGNVLNEILNQATGERLVDWIFRELEMSILAKALQAVALQETPKNRFISGQGPLLLG